MELEDNSFWKFTTKKVNGENEKYINIQNFNDKLTKEETEKFIKKEQYYRE